MAVRAGIAAGYAMQPLAYSPPPPANVASAEPAADDEAGEDEPAESGGGSLAAGAKAASMKAERAAIAQTLGQGHWNRRKAAQILGVSYKTLLNKIQGWGMSQG